MFKIRKKDDYVILVLLIVIIIASILLFFKDNLFETESAIEIQSKPKVDRIVKEVKKNNHSIKKTKIFMVQLGGAVNKAGVYKCKEGERIYQLLEKAGGAKLDANLDMINLVAEVKDGEKIIIPYKASTQEFSNSKTTNSSKININRASKEQLEQLKGVGPSTAEKIIEYRQQQGRFNSLEELTKVPGIGAKTLEKLRSKITH